MTSEPSGVDLARQALLAAREQAKKNGATSKRKPKQRTGQAVRRDGREPLVLGAAVGMMMTERGLVAPAAGGSILAAAAPELAGHVQAVAFDADTGRLDVAPDAPAYGTKLRWSQPKLIEAAHAQVPDANIRTLRILPPVPAKAGPASDTLRQPPAEPAAPEPRRAPSQGYRQAIAALRGAKQEQDDRYAPGCPRRARAAEPGTAERLRGRTQAS